MSTFGEEFVWGVVPGRCLYCNDERNGEFHQIQNTRGGREREREIEIWIFYLGTSYGGAFSHDGIGVADLAKLRYEEMTQSRRVGGKRCQLLFIQTLKDNDKRKC